MRTPASHTCSIHSTLESESISSSPGTDSFQSSSEHRILSARSLNSTSTSTLLSSHLYPVLANPNVILNVNSQHSKCFLTLKELNSRRPVSSYHIMHFRMCKALLSIPTSTRFAPESGQQAFETNLANGSEEACQRCLLQL